MNKLQLLIFQLYLHLVILLQEQYHIFFTNQSQLINPAQWQMSYIETQGLKDKKTPKKITFLRQTFKKTIVKWKKVQEW